MVTNGEILDALVKVASDNVVKDSQKQAIVRKHGEVTMGTAPFSYKKPRVAFTIADENNMWMVEKFTNSLRKFHSEKELPLVVISGDDLKTRLKKDPNFFYRATPIIAKELMQEYETVYKADCDQIITGDLDFLLKSKGWDVGTVINFNRLDAPIYGAITVWDIGIDNYYNCGLVAMSSEKFIDEWLRLCNSWHFGNYRMREQDMLNILCHYFDYKVKCFDMYDQVHQYSAWHGLIAKSEWQHIELMEDKTAKTGKRLLLKPSGDGYVQRLTEVKVLHWAGGNMEKKMHYRTRFKEEVISYLDELTND